MACIVGMEISRMAKFIKYGGAKLFRHLKSSMHFR